MVMPRWRNGETFKDISLDFAYGASVDFTITGNQAWQTIELEGIGNDIITNYVNISVITIYPGGDMDRGFREIKVFGYASGIMTYLACI